MESLTNISFKATDKGLNETLSSLAPLQLEARSAFQTNSATSSYRGIVASSPESSLDSQDIHPFRSGAEESRQVTGLPSVNIAAPQGFPFSRSTSDGYEASGGEDSDRVSSRIIQTSTNWSNILFDPGQDESVVKLKASSSSSQANMRIL
ncbi:probable protein S-acyltransferase 22 [Hibiscus syriacus]|uniref:probable protein S-acyltransferase 22 n=1 Tax=Hibiscus syriacus TaxID=106335 RepID=UPI0019235EC8|nr:probable protein S-acyltransferase 22 [Hibiscus syriacus]